MFDFYNFFLKSRNHSFFIFDNFFFIFFRYCFYNSISFIHRNPGKIQYLHCIFLIKYKSACHIFCLNNLIKYRNTIVKVFSGFKDRIHTFKARSNSGNKSRQFRNIFWLIFHYFYLVLPD